MMTKTLADSGTAIQLRQGDFGKTVSGSERGALIGATTHSARPLDNFVVAMSDLAFRPLTRGDLPQLCAWIARPHIAEWWGESPVLADVEAEYTPSIAGEVPQWCYIALDAGAPIGFIQAYSPAHWHVAGWWLEENDPGVRGIDQFLADPDALGRGLGTAMVRAFMAELLRDPTVTRVQVDPHPGNARAIRCYQKAGFQAVRVVETPDGPALLMYADRSACADDCC